MVPADSDSLPRGESYSGYPSALATFPYGALTLCGRRFRAVPVATRVLTGVLQPRGGHPPRFGLVRVRSPLLTESRFLSLPPGTEMFQFPGFAPRTYGFSTRSFGNPGINARLTATPGFSQSSTPFIASWRQDIPHMPLVAWPHCSCPPARGPPPLAGHVTSASKKQDTRQALSHAR